MNDQKPENSNQGPLDYYLEEDNISLIDILLILVRHIKVILIIPMIFCTLTIIYVLFIANPVYTSTSKIMSSSGSSGMSQSTGKLAAQFGYSLPTGQSGPKWVYSEIINSRTLARVILKRKFNTEKYGQQKSLLQILTYGNDEPANTMDILEIKAVNSLLGMIEVSENTITAIYTINLHASEPKLAAEINKVIIEELDAHQKEYNKKQTSETRQFIEERIMNIEKELMKAEEDLKNFMDRNRRIENSPTLQLKQQRLTREAAVLTGVFTTLKQQLETTKIEEVKESDYVVILDPPEVPLEYSKPEKRKLVILAGLLGIGLGIGIAFVREYVENREKEEKEKIVQAQSLLIKDFTQMYHILLRFLKSIIPFKFN